MGSVGDDGGSERGFVEILNSWKIVLISERKILLFSERKVTKFFRVKGNYLHLE